MSQPNQPLPREIYTRRRIAAVVVLVVVIALIWWAVSSLTGGGDDGDPAPAAASSPAASSPAPSSSTTPTSTSTAPAATTAAPTTSEKTDCSLADLRVEAAPGQPSLGPDTAPNFFLTVTNPTRGDCRVDLSDHPLQFEVFTLTTYQRVWADTDCNRPEDAGELRLAPGASKTWELTSWSRTTSAPDGCGDRRPVDPASYLLYTHVGDVVSQPATFNLE